MITWPSITLLTRESLSQAAYSKVSNKGGVFLILFENIFPTTYLHALLEPPSLLISEKPGTNTGPHKYCILLSQLKFIFLNIHFMKTRTFQASGADIS